MKTDEEIRKETEEAINEFRKYWGDRTSLTSQERKMLDALYEEFGDIINPCHDTGKR